jgi:hypothetical protein
LAGPESSISNPHDAFEDLSEELRNIRLKGANTIAEGLTLLEDLNRAQADAFFGVQKEQTSIKRLPLFNLYL